MKIKILNLFFLVLTLMLLTSVQVTSTKALETTRYDYFFASDALNPTYSDNVISINITNNYNAIISARFHAKARYPTGIHDEIKLIIPYRSDEVILNYIKVSSKQANYSITNETDGLTLVIPSTGQVNMIIDMKYTILNILNNNNLSLRFASICEIDELTISTTIQMSGIWISRSSINLEPKPSKTTYFLLAEEALPWLFSKNLASVKPNTYNLSFNLTTQPYNISDIPYIAMAITIFPLIIVMVYKLISNRRAKDNISLLSIALRNITRRMTRFLLSILGVAIPSLLLMTISTQQLLSKSMMSQEVLPRVNWAFLLILITTIIIGSLQVVNTMLSSMIERIRELGIIKAIGFESSFISKMVMTESLFIGLIGGLLGSVSAIIYLILTGQLFYGQSLSNLALLSSMFNMSGEIGLLNPLLRNFLIALFVVFVAHLIIRFYVSEKASVLVIVIPLLMFSWLLRPMDPTLVDNFIGIIPNISLNIVLITVLPVFLSVVSGAYIAYWVGKIKVVEALSR